MTEETLTTLITDEIRELIGVEGEPFEVGEAVESGAVRRFSQATMDDDPAYWDQNHAQQTKYGGVIAPPLYPGFVNRRPAGSPDPLDRFKEDPEWDGTTGGEKPASGGLPPVNLPLRRLLNGGVTAEFFAYAQHGDRITGQQKYIDITERTGRTGLMVIIVTETTYTNQDGVLLCKVRNTSLRR
jgi:acyl dehydratase